VPWWALAVGFYLAEVVVVHFQFRGEAHTFSLSEIPLVLGLFLLPPAEFIGANLVGAGLALVIARRQAPLKLAFNLSQFFLVAAVAAGRLPPRPGGATGRPIGSSGWPRCWRRWRPTAWASSPSPA
jgi:hypothetical protein